MRFIGVARKVALMQTIERAFRSWASLMPQLSRYTLASIAALATDFSVYLALCSAEFKASLAGVAGYAVGMVIHYILSSRFVFDTQGSYKSEPRRFAEFMLSGLAGLTLTGFIIAMATGAFGIPPIGAKFAAVVISFAAVFAIRRSFVFGSSKVYEN
jgi:putative flippase GtrA